MLKANKEQLETINQRWNDLQKSSTIGFDYQGEGTEVTDFTIDENGRITMDVTEYYLNNQYALHCRYHERHPRLKQNEIDYLLGNTDELQVGENKIVKEKFILYMVDESGFDASHEYNNQDDAIADVVEFWNEGDGGYSRVSVHQVKTKQTVKDINFENQIWYADHNM